MIIFRCSAISGRTTRCLKTSWPIGLIHLIPRINPLEGFDPNADFWESGDTLSNIGEEEELALEKMALTWGSWSGHNSAHTTQFAEHFVHTGKERVLGIMLHVADNYVASASSHMVLKIWSDENNSRPGNYTAKAYCWRICLRIQSSLLNSIPLCLLQIHFLPVMNCSMTVRQILFQPIWRPTAR